ncbi:MAG: DinB family protein [Acidobacteriaceae bacterium]
MPDHPSTSSRNLEPWLRGTLTEVPAVARAVLHAMEMAQEDARRWCADLTTEELHAQPFGMTPAAFHIRHIGRSLDRLLTYAEGNQLDVTQMAALKVELEPGASKEALFQELAMACEEASLRVRALATADFEQPRGVGRKALPTTVGGLLVHCADHTLRHTGQLVTTAKLLLALRNAPGAPAK